MSKVTVEPAPRPKRYFRDRPRKRGPKSEYDPKLPAIVSAMELDGASDREIADALGVSKSTLWKWRKQRPAFRAACDAAKDLCDARVVGSLYENAISGNVVAQIFYLKNRLPRLWRDRREIDIGPSEAFVELLDRVSRGEFADPGASAKVIEQASDSSGSE